MREGGSRPVEGGRSGQLAGLPDRIRLADALWRAFLGGDVRARRRRPYRHCVGLGSGHRRGADIGHPMDWNRPGRSRRVAHGMGGAMRVAGVE